MKKVRLGELLISEGLINQQQLEEALAKQKVTRQKLGQVLIELGFLSENELLRVLSKELSYEYTDNPLLLLDSAVGSLVGVGHEFAQQNKVLPLYLSNGMLYVATADPLDFIALEDVSMMTGLETVPVVAPTAAIDEAIQRVYSISDFKNSEIAQEMSEEDLALIERVDAAPIVKLVNSLIESAYKSNASDIHIEPYDEETTIRFRVDGNLKTHVTIRRDVHDLIVTRIKIIAGMNIAEKRVPQDGAFRTIVGGSQIDLRVNTMPTNHGEKAVLRLLGTNLNISYRLDDLKINSDIKASMKRIIQAPNGIILVTGPTGSGKTTTLYSVLNELAVDEKSVVTIEDPIEKSFDGITQVQINTKAGLSFANGLRSILRQDPDIIMVGEIRDAETAEIAIRAAITGHLVLSTLHTNDALSSVVRLTDMGVESYLVASSVKAVLAQRLVRTVCKHCGRTVATSQEDQILMQDPTLVTEVKGLGCDHCDHTGYSGRTAVVELVVIDEQLQTMIANGATMDRLNDYIKSKNVRLLRDDVLRLIRQGVTTVEEARRILFNVEDI